MTRDRAAQIRVGNLEACADAIVGDRSGQEDSIAVSPWPKSANASGAGVLLALADGMGGHSGGEVASQIAVSAGVSAFLSAAGDVRERLNRACHTANAAIAEERARNSQLDGMGSTLVIAAIDSRGVHWVSVGDSPLWRWRKGDLQRLNRDHSMGPVLDEMAERGEITPEAAAADPTRGRLRSALTGGELALVDLSPEPASVNKGDSIVLASDGVLGLDSRQLARRLRSGKHPREVAGLLLRDLRAVRTEGLDNSSIAIVSRRRGFLGIF